MPFENDMFNIFFFQECFLYALGVNVINGKNGIHFTYVKDGRPSGEAYLELESQEDLDQALSKDKHHMGKRYIDGIIQLAPVDLVLMFCITNTRCKHIKA